MREKPINCSKCGMISYLPYDAFYKYCPSCDEFLEDFVGHDLYQDQTQRDKDFKRVKQMTKTYHENKEHREKIERFLICLATVRFSLLDEDVRSYLQGYKLANSDIDAVLNSIREMFRKLVEQELKGFR